MRRLALRHPRHGASAFPHSGFPDSRTRARLAAGYGSRGISSTVHNPGGRMRWTSLLLAAFTWPALACAAASPGTVPVQGSPPEISALAGEWNGEYESSESGRSGSIMFRLTVGSDTARGDVVMVPRVAVQQGYLEQGSSTRPTSMPPLTVSFMRAERGTVSGVLDPYEDPECRCAAYTTFTGRVRGDRIEGTYATRTAASARYTLGRWSVTRGR
jgi:hypothetical protein